MARKLHASKLMARRWVTPVGLGAVLLAFAGFSGVPDYRKMSRLKAETATNRAAIENSVKQSQDLRELTKQVQALRLEVGEYDKLVPPTMNMQHFFEAMGEAQRGAQLTDVNRSTLAKTKLGRCDAQPMELNITCNAEQLYDFLQRLEKLERRSSVSKLNIESKDPGQGTISAAMTLSIYAASASKDLPKP